MPYPSSEIFYSWEDCGLICLARVLGFSGTAISQASMSSITCKVFDVDNSNTQTGSETPVVADTIYDALQTDAAWPYDVGYNFRFIVPASCFPAGGHRYRVQFILTPASGDEEPFAIVYDIHCRDLLGQ